MKTLGPVTSIGYGDKPVQLQVPPVLDEPEIELVVRHPNAPPVRTRINTDRTRSATVILSMGSTMLNQVTSFLDRAVGRVPEAVYYWGVIGAGATVAFISSVNGLNRITFVAIVAVFLMTVLFFAFSRIGRGGDVVVRFVGYVILIVSAVAFVVTIGACISVGLTCRPPVFVYLLGVDEACKSSKLEAVDNTMTLVKEGCYFFQHDQHEPVALDTEYEAEQRRYAVNLLKEFGLVTVVGTSSPSFDLEDSSRLYRLALGERRANAVKEKLVSFGIQANKIETWAHGKEPPTPHIAPIDCFARVVGGTPRSPEG